MRMLEKFTKRLNGEYLEIEKQTMAYTSCIRVMQESDRIYVDQWVDSSLVTSSFSLVSIMTTHWNEEAPITYGALWADHIPEQLLAKEDLTAQLLYEYFHRFLVQELAGFWTESTFIIN